MKEFANLINSGDKSSTMTTSLWKTDLHWNFKEWWNKIWFAKTKGGKINLKIWNWWMRKILKMGNPALKHQLTDIGVLWIDIIIFDLRKVEYKNTIKESLQKNWTQKILEINIQNWMRFARSGRYSDLVGTVVEVGRGR